MDLGHFVVVLRATFGALRLPRFPAPRDVWMRAAMPMATIGTLRKPDEPRAVPPPDDEEDEDDSAYAEARYRQYAYYNQQLRLAALRHLHDRRDLEALIPGVPCLRRPVDGGQLEGRLFQAVMTQ